MYEGERSRYLEGIVHVTRASPYSIHKCDYKTGGSTALYLHLHPEMELFYLEEGELSFEIEEKEYHMQAGDGIFIPQNMLHTAKAQSEEGTFRAICFAPEYLALAMEERDYQKYVHPISECGLDYALVLKKENGWHNAVLSALQNIFYKSEDMENPDLLIRGYLLVIWQYIYQYHISGLLSRRKMGRREDYLEEVLGFIHTHYEDDLSLKQLAGTAHMSEGQFCRSFKKAMGMTPFTYLKRYRIRKSCVYLTETGKKISEICSLCGFNNISYFNREFLSVMKTTPSKYRLEAERYLYFSGNSYREEEK